MENLTFKNIDIQEYLNTNDSCIFIDKDSIAKNINIMKKHSEPRGSKFSAVIKNNAYGLDIKNIYPIMASHTSELFVATVNEAIDLRKISSSDKTIYLLHGPNKYRINDIYNNNITPVLNTLSHVYMWNDFAKSKNETLPCIIHIETGMNRLGLTESEIEQMMFNKDKALSNLNILYVMSHFACADMEVHDSKEQQYNSFIYLTEKYFPSNIKRSLAASDGIYASEKYLFDQIRPGVAMYGGEAAAYIKKEEELINSISMYSTIIQTKEVKKGESIGYGHIWNAKKDTLVGYISAGYGDGIMRNISNESCVYINNIPCPIIGRVSMDLTGIDISHLPEDIRSQERQVVEVIGKNCDINKRSENFYTIDCELINYLSTSRYPKIFF